MTERSKLSHGHTPAATVPAHGASKYDANPSGIVVGLTLNLSWQLAIVVLVPILGGHVLDNTLKTSPWLTVGGFALAMILMVVVIRRMLQQLNEYMKKSDDEDKDTAE